MKIEEYINTIKTEFRDKADGKNALAQKAYMRNQFEYYGIKSVLRREIQKPFFIRKHLPAKTELDQLVKILWQEPQRECQYFSQELTYKYVRQFKEEDIKILEFMIKHKSWWDTVDFIAVKLVGEYFKMFSDQRDGVVKIWLESNNIWLQRSCLLFQLKYKKDLDTIFLAYVINALLGSKEFFINKAIGWVLREYSRTDPEWVVEFVKSTNLSSLSKREALRLLKL